MSARGEVGRLNRSHKASRDGGLPPIRGRGGLPVWPADAFDPDLTIPPHGPTRSACALWPECDCDACCLDGGGGIAKAGRLAAAIILALTLAGAFALAFAFYVLGVR